MTNISDVTSPSSRRRRGLTTTMVAGTFLISSAVGLSSAAAARPASAPAPVSLGRAAAFGVLAGSTVTNTGASVINRDVGVSPGTAVTGFPPGRVNGSIRTGVAGAGGAQTDLTTAYDNAAGRAGGTDMTGQDLGGKTLTAGVRKFSSSVGLTGTLTLNGKGDTGSVFIFQVGSTLTTASASKVHLINGARACHVYWQIGSSATLGTTTAFAGNILALTSITATTGVTVTGRLLARNGAVTLDTNTVNKGVAC